MPTKNKLPSVREMMKGASTLESVLKKPIFYDFKPGRPCTYDEKLCEIVVGLGRDGLIKEEISAYLGICTTTFDNWVKNYPDFKHAWEIAKTAKAAWLYKIYRLGYTDPKRVNAPLLKFAMKNLTNWKEVEYTENKNDNNSNITYTIYKEEENL